MKKAEFLKDVVHEIEMLKLHATEEEKSRLDFDMFDPESVYRCIYGQLTGNCENKRAHTLMDKACKRVWNVQSALGTDILLGKNFKEVNNFINGEYDEQMWGYSRSFTHLSALEGYIALKGAKNKQIIQYIKGEIDTLKL